jgi:8-amino-7-oxononanoate synthase
MGTLSKALASEGGYVAGKRQLIELMINRARSFIFTTALAPATIAVSLKALDIVKSSPEARQNLIANSIWFQERLRSAGFNLPESRTAILSIILGDPEKAVAFSAELYAEGIYIPAIRPPTVPSGTSRLRISLMATHTREDLEEAALAIEKVGRNLRVI